MLALRLLHRTMLGGFLRPIVWSLLLGAASVEAAIIISGYDPLVNDRFANDSSFLITSSDPAFLSGVAIADSGTGRWVTMVSRNVFISAEHYFPSNGSSVTFYESNDPLGGQVTRTVQSSQRVGTSDIRIGVLDTPLPVGYRSFNFATEDLNSFSDFDDPELNPYRLGIGIMFGRSPTSYADISQEMSLGLNVIDSWDDSVTAAGTTDVSLVAVANEATDPNFVPSEAFLQSGDSGAPLMVISGGELTIIGINWYIDNPGDTLINGFSYVGNYDTEIQGYIDANPVPEFAGFAVLAGLAASSTISCRRRRKA